MGSKKLGVAVLYGVTTIFVIALFTSLLLSLILRFTNVQESSLTWIILGISFIALFIGGFVSGGKGKEKGWLIGGMTGLVYTLIIFLFQYLGFDSSFTMEETLYHLGFLGAASIGGIFGVNVMSNSKVT